MFCRNIAAALYIKCLLALTTIADLILMCFLLKPNTLHSTLSYSREREQTEYYMKRERENKRCFNAAHLQKRAFLNITVMANVPFLDLWFTDYTRSSSELLQFLHSKSHFVSFLDSRKSLRTLTDTAALFSVVPILQSTILHLLWDYDFVCSAAGWSIRKSKWCYKDEPTTQATCSSSFSLLWFCFVMLSAGLSTALWGLFIMHAQGTVTTP